MIIFFENAHVLPCTLRFSQQIIIQPRLKSENHTNPKSSAELLIDYEDGVGIIVRGSAFNDPNSGSVSVRSSRGVGGVITTPGANSVSSGPPPQPRHSLGLQ